MPVAGGSAPRYRDFWLIQEERWDGALVAAGTNGLSLQFAMNMQQPLCSTSLPPLMPLPMLGETPHRCLGLVSLPSYQTKIFLSSADPDDANNDGISGRA